MISPVATLVIPTKNRWPDLQRALQSALTQTVPLEIIVLDDGSTDGSATKVKEAYPQIRLIVCEGPSRGPTVRRNQGVELASTPIVFSMDDDAELVSPRTIEQTLAEFDEPRVGIVGIPYIDVQKDQVVRQRTPETSRIMLSEAFVGAAYAVRRAPYLAVGGYREQWFQYGEEGDLSIRMLARGYVVRLGRADPVHHHESPRRHVGRMLALYRRNDVLFAWHNVPWPAFPMHLLGTTLKGLWFGLHAGCLWSSAKGIAKGYADIFRYWSKRVPVPRAVYRLSRRLRKQGPLALDSIQAELPALNTG